jgi:hypothetical protein
MPLDTGGKWLTEGRLVSCGLLTFVSGFVLSAVAVQSELSPIVRGANQLLFGILSVAGLVLMTIADIDINDYLRHNQIRMIVSVLIYSGAMTANAIPLWFAWPFLLTVCPFLVLLLRYEHVVGMREGYPLFTHLLLASFELDLLANGIFFGTQAHDVPGLWYSAAAYILAALCTFGVGWWYGPARLFRTTNATYQFKVTTYVYLFAYGFGQGIALVADPSSRQFSSTEQILQWAFVAVHVLPPVLTFGCQERILRSLGLCWLSRRRLSRAASAFELQSIPEAERRGDLIEIEQAIISRVDLNAIVLDISTSSGGGDSYTLLHLTVLNDHLDALQRLLNTGAVEINKPTGRGGVHYSSERRRAGCMQQQC